MASVRAFSMAAYIADLSSTNIAVFTAGAAVTLLALQAVGRWRSTSNMDSIPTHGVPSGAFSFLRGTLDFLAHARGIVEEGTRKHPGRAFKVPFGTRWLVLVNGRTLIEDIRKAPENALSLPAGLNTLLHLEFTVGWDQYHEPIHTGVIRNAMTKNIQHIFPELHNEVEVALNDLFPAEKRGWSSIHVMKQILPLISRVSNRAFVGDRCRDPELIRVTSEVAEHCAADAVWLHPVPKFLRPLAMRLVGHNMADTRSMMRVLGPMLQHRLDMDAKYGADWPEEDRPNDLISWLLDASRGKSHLRTIRNLTLYILAVNFGALHNTAQAVGRAIYFLAANPQWMDPLRAEIEPLVANGGWSKATMREMVKLDSFLKECARVEPGVAVDCIRMAKQDFAFSDGTTIPKGTLVGAACLVEHMTDSNYPHAEIFDPWRHVDSKSDTTLNEGGWNHMDSPSSSYLAWGIGRGSCPGRFFASNEIKLITAVILMTYDLRLPDGVDSRPQDEWVAWMSNANQSAEILFRRR